MLFCFLAFKAQASNLSLLPGSGTFPIEETFELSLYLDTEGKKINTVEIDIAFLPDKLQLVSPSAGKSVIDFWATAPSFNNQSGRVELRGGITGGLNSFKALIATLVFRGKSPGSAIVKILDSSKILLHDGSGTEDLDSISQAVITLTLPPPAGPIVISSTHPDQSKWHKQKDVALNWGAEDGVEGYSYTISKDPLETPDSISEGGKTFTTYQDLGSGQYFFHIKSLRDNVWGGTTHYSVMSDYSPPAKFPIEIIPGSWTTKRNPVFNFSTTDGESGLDHYEMKIVPLNIINETHAEGESEEGFFIEIDSPYISKDLEVGLYEVLIRAYDAAGNFVESEERLKIINPLVSFTEDNKIVIFGFAKISLFFALLSLAIVLGALVFGVCILKRRYRMLVENSGSKLPKNIREKLEELRELKKKYGHRSKLALIFLPLAFSLFFSLDCRAQEQEQENIIQESVSSEKEVLSPPLITTVSEDISNDEIFYIGGETDNSEVAVIVYIQKKDHSQMMDFTVATDDKKDWFYRHNNFLSAGEYIVWTQSKLGEQFSPPSSQILVKVEKAALQIGSSRLTREAIFWTVIIGMLLAILLLAVYLSHSFVKLKKHKRRLTKELREAEESIKRGLAFLKKDIEKELEILRRTGNSRRFSQDKEEAEKKLIEDIARIERHIGKEMEDIERLEKIDIQV